MGKIERLQQRIHLIRGKRVMLDADLAALYGVLTFRLNEADSRHSRRFPGDFMFRLTGSEHEHLKSQFAMSSWGGRRTPPRVFTEQGVAMLSGVLNSERAIRVNIAIMRAFVKIRQLAMKRGDLAGRLEALEKALEGHDIDIRRVVQAIESLLPASAEPKKRIGFREKRVPYRAGKVVLAR